MALVTIPQRPLGRDVWDWATGLRLDRVTADSRLGRRLCKRDQIIGAGPRQLTRRDGIRLRPRVTGASGQVVTFADGGTSEYDAAVWATGLTQDSTFTDIPGVTDEQGRLRQSLGHTPSLGLYTLGITWQRTRGLRAARMGGKRPCTLSRWIRHAMNTPSIAHHEPVAPGRRLAPPTRVRLRNASAPVRCGVVAGGIMAASPEGAASVSASARDRRQAERCASSTAEPAFSWQWQTFRGRS